MLAHILLLWLLSAGMSLVASSAEADVKQAVGPASASAAADVLPSGAMHHVPLKNFMLLLDRGDEAHDAQMGAVTRDMLFAMGQEAAPIVSLNASMLHTLVKAFLNLKKKWSEEKIATFLVDRDAVRSAIGRRNDPSVVQKPQDIRDKLSALPFDDDMKGLGVACYLIFSNFDTRFFCFEYLQPNEKNPSGYLIVPRKIVSDDFDEQQVLQATGFKNSNLHAIDVKTLVARVEQEEKEPRQLFKQAEFEKRVLTFFRTQFEGKHFGVFWTGHGQLFDRDLEHAPIIGGLGFSATYKLLQLLARHGVTFTCLTTCYGGGVNLELVRNMLKDIKAPMLFASLAISDITVGTFQGYAIPKDMMKAASSPAAITRVMKLYEDESFMNQLIFPIYGVTGRFDKFFQDLDLLHNALAKNPRLLQVSPKNIPQLVTQILGHVTVFYPALGVYEMASFPLIRLPSYDGSFTPLEFISKIQFLTYADVKKKELQGRLNFRSAADRKTSKESEKKLQAVQAASITIENKQLLMIYPSSVNVPLIFKGSLPFIINMRPGDRHFVFLKYEAPQAAFIDCIKSLALTVFPYRKRFFVKELICKDKQVFDLLIIVDKVAPEERNDNTIWDKVQVYYHLEENQKQTYRFFPMPQKEVVVPLYEQIEQYEMQKASIFQNVTRKELVFPYEFSLEQYIPEMIQRKTTIEELDALQKTVFSFKTEMSSEQFKIVQKLLSERREKLSKEK